MEIPKSHISVNNKDTVLIFGVHITPTNDYMLVNFQLDIFTITCDIYVRTRALRNVAYRASAVCRHILHIVPSNGNFKKAYLNK